MTPIFMNDFAYKPFLTLASLNESVKMADHPKGAHAKASVPARALGQAEGFGRENIS
ncbi:MAG: hypothetical protein N3B01_07925 [Verrucomicrobiae bacterium]|nr:hypothetical protein [Verrucomicrobiae bacterium]